MPEVNRLNLPRIQDETELEALKADGSLLPIVPVIRCGSKLTAGDLAALLPSVDIAFCRRSDQAVYTRFHQQISGELGGADGEGAEEAAAA